LTVLVGCAHTLDMDHTDQIDHAEHDYWANHCPACDGDLRTPSTTCEAAECHAANEDDGRPAPHASGWPHYGGPEQVQR
jgi:hypothetical protein